MNPDPSLVSDPSFVLLAWAGGVSLAAAVVTLRSLVGPGFTWLTAAMVLLIGSWPAAAGHGPAVVAVILTAVGAVVVSFHRLSSGLALATAAVAFGIAAVDLGGPVLAVTALFALGGITGEMLLGHWYLVDPTLPRWVLRSLAVAGMAGIAADGAALAWLLGLGEGGATTIVYWGLLATTVVLMVAVVGALRYPAYSGVMAATGLSYLAVLTGLAAVFFGRVLASGAGPFA